jgi:hypothetical protein
VEDSEFLIQLSSIYGSHITLCLLLRYTGTQIHNQALFGENIVGAKGIYILKAFITTSL